MLYKDLKKKAKVRNTVAVFTNASEVWCANLVMPGKEVVIRSVKDATGKAICFYFYTVVGNKLIIQFTRPVAGKVDYYQLDKPADGYIGNMVINQVKLTFVERLWDKVKVFAANFY